MSFFCHSFAARREQDYAVLLKGERDIAAAVLAGFTIVERPNKYWERFPNHYELFSPSGEALGTNDTRGGAAAYAVELMGLAVQPWWAR